MSQYIKNYYGIFVSIVAWASNQRSRDKTPYWRTLKEEGQIVVQRGRSNIKYYVQKLSFIWR